MYMRSIHVPLMSVFNNFHGSNVLLQGLPSFGPFLKERKSIMASHKENADLLHTELKPEKVRPAFKPDKPVPLVKVS